MGVSGGGWNRESGGGRFRGSWTDEPVYLVSVRKGLQCWPWSWVGLNVSRKE